MNSQLSNVDETMLISCRGIVTEDLHQRVLHKHDQRQCVCRRELTVFNKIRVQLLKREENEDRSV